MLGTKLPQKLQNRSISHLQRTYQMSGFQDLRLYKYKLQEQHKIIFAHLVKEKKTVGMLCEFITFRV